MNKRETIDRIMSAVKLEDVFTSPSNFKSEFNSLLREIHPDVCTEAGASDATAKLNSWKDYFENGKQYKDDVGQLKTNGYWVEFASAEPNLAWSHENYGLFMSWKDPSSIHFQKYLPESAEATYPTNGDPAKVLFSFRERAIPLTDLTLPQEHVNWVLNRLLEFCAYMESIKFSHCGLTPESVFITPSDHGIQVASFYHLTKFGNQIKTVSGKYRNWLPQSVFDTKIATNNIDVESSKRIAAYLLGDRSGSGVKFRKTHNPDFIDFILSASTESSYDTLVKYRALLAKNFKKEFHILNL